MYCHFWVRLSLKNFLAIHDNPSVFIASQWQNDKSAPNGKYLIYRTAVTLFLFTTWLFSITHDEVAEKWPIYLTNWGYTVCTIQSILATLMLSTSFLSKKLESNYIPKNFLKAYPVYWVLNTIATPTAFGITAIYWTFIYDPKIMDFSATNFFVHGSNSLAMFIDIWMVCHPVKLLHFIYPTVFGILYASFSIVYFLAGGTSRDGSRYIYKFIDWEKPSSTLLTCLGVTFFLLLLHLINYFLFIARKKLYEIFCVNKTDIYTRKDNKNDAAYVNDVFC